MQKGLYVEETDSSVVCAVQRVSFLKEDGAYNAEFPSARMILFYHIQQILLLYQVQHQGRQLQQLFRKKLGYDVIHYG